MTMRDNGPFDELIDDLKEERLIPAAILAIIRAWDMPKSDQRVHPPHPAAIQLLKECSDLCQIPLPDSTLVYDNNRPHLRHNSGSDMSCKGDKTDSFVIRATDMIQDSPVNPANAVIVFGHPMSLLLDLLIAKICVDLCPTIKDSISWNRLQNYSGVVSALVHLQAKCPIAKWKTFSTTFYYGLTVSLNPLSPYRTMLLVHCTSTTNILMGTALHKSDFNSGKVKYTYLSAPLPTVAANLVHVAEKLVQDAPLIQDRLVHALACRQTEHHIHVLSDANCDSYFIGGLTFEQTVNQKMLGRLSVSITRGPALIKARKKGGPAALSSTKKQYYLTVQSHVTGACYGPYAMLDHHTGSANIIGTLRAALPFVDPLPCPPSRLTRFNVLS